MDRKTLMRLFSEEEVNIRKDMPSSFRAMFNEIHCTQCQKLLTESNAMICASCKMYEYCSKECQRLNWRIHKLLCPSTLYTANLILKVVKEAFNVSDGQNLLDDDLDLDIYMFIFATFGKRPAIETSKTHGIVMHCGFKPIGALRGTEWTKTKESKLFQISKVELVPKNLLPAPSLIHRIENSEILRKAGVDVNRATLVDVVWIPRGSEESFCTTICIPERFLNFFRTTRMDDLTGPGSAQKAIDMLNESFWLLPTRSKSFWVDRVWYDHVKGQTQKERDASIDKIVDRLCETFESPSHISIAPIVVLGDSHPAQDPSNPPAPN